jgi:hypothetical protein
MMHKLDSPEDAVRNSIRLATCTRDESRARLTSLLPNSRNRYHRKKIFDDWQDKLQILRTEKARQAAGIIQQRLIKRIRAGWHGRDHFECAKCTESPDDPRKRTRPCLGCGCARYCSRKCQKADWKMHKAYCQILPTPTSIPRCKCELCTTERTLRNQRWQRELNYRLRVRRALHRDLFRTFARKRK